MGVREDHTGDGEPVSTIVAVDLHQPGREPGRVLVGGHDFFASPRLSPDGRWLMWLTWAHPNMPWNGTTLWLSELDGAGRITEPRTIAGSVSESVFQPNGQLTAGQSSSCPIAVAGGISTASILPCGHLNRLRQWPLSSACRCGNSVQRPKPVPNRIVCSYSKAGLGQLAVLDLKGKVLRPFETPFTEFSSVQVSGDRAVFRAGASYHPASIVMLDLTSGAHRVLKKKPIF
jgi:hypothetical protein